MSEFRDLTTSLWPDISRLTELGMLLRYDTYRLAYSTMSVFRDLSTSLWLDISWLTELGMTLSWLTKLGMQLRYTPTGFRTLQLVNFVTWARRSDLTYPDLRNSACHILTYEIRHAITIWHLQASIRYNEWISWPDHVALTWHILT